MLLLCRRLRGVLRFTHACRLLSPSSSSQVKTSEFYRYSRQLRQEVDQALSYFHDVNQQPLVETRSNRIRSVRPQTAVFRGMIGHSMVNSKILLLQRPKVSARLFVYRSTSDFKSQRVHFILVLFFCYTEEGFYSSERGIKLVSLPPSNLFHRLKSVSVSGQ